MKESDEDLPRPMVNMKPAKKKGTAAERFTSDHHGKYEAHSRRSDRFEQVDKHNSGYPKMRDELDKRRSMVDNKAIPITKSRHSRSKHELQKSKHTTRENSKSELICSTCRKLINQEHLKKLALKIRPKTATWERAIIKRNFTKNSDLARRRTRRCRHSLRDRCPCSTHERIKARSVNVTPVKKESETSVKSDVDSMEEDCKESDLNKYHSKEVVNAPVIIRNSNSSVDNKSFIYNNDSRGTSYHSYHSMNHEPML